MSPCLRRAFLALLTIAAALFTPWFMAAKTFIPSTTQSRPSQRTERSMRRESFPDLREQEKEWNIIVYIAGSNNLYRFVEPNLKQMEQVGSNKHVNILCQVDQFGANEMKRYEMHKNRRRTVWRASQVPPEERRKNAHRYTSGTPESLEDFLDWSISNYPAKRQFVVLWNHGSGIIDPYRWGRLITELHHTFFTTDPTTGKMVLNRDDDLNDLLENPGRGIAFNDTNSHFLTNQDLSAVFQNVRRKHKCFDPDRAGQPRKKIDIIGMDACCMASIEIATQLKDHTDYLIFSQEVELGAGWNYATALKRLGDTSREAPTALTLCNDIIRAYQREYEPITPDYTLSVVDFTAQPANRTKSAFGLLEEKIDTLASLLATLLRGPAGQQVANKIKDVRKKSMDSTWFYDNNYIDLHHFLVSLHKHLRLVLRHDQHREILNAIATTITDARSLLTKAVPTFVHGSSFSTRPLHGLSIYFPRRIIHASYERTLFAQHNNWASFLSMFMRK